MSLASGLRQGAGQVLFRTDARVFDVGAAGQRFILVLPNPAAVPAGIHVVIDWVRELEERLSRSP